MATAPRPGAARRKALEEAAITVKVDGKPYTLRVSEVSALDTSALRRATGMSLQRLMHCAQTDPDLDVVAGIVWLARRQNGTPGITYESVAGELGYGSEFDIEDGAAEDEDSPEA